MATPRVTKDLTTGFGTISFPKVFENTKGKKDDGTDDWNVQFIIPKTINGQKNPAVREIMAAIKEVGEAKWGDAYKQVRIPLRDGDKEAKGLCDDGTTKGEKYPERLGCYFINARSQKPVPVFNRNKELITNSDELYAGCQARISVTFYPYTNSGNSGIGVALNGVQKVSDGEPIGGGGRPTVDSMFDLLDDEEDTGLDDEDEFEEDEEPTPPPAKKAPAKKAPAKKAPAKKPAPVVEVDDDDEDDLLAEDESEVDEEWDDL